MAAKFYIWMLLVVLVSSDVHSARLRRPQDKGKTSNFLYEKRSIPPKCCLYTCENCLDPKIARVSCSNINCNSLCGYPSLCCCPDF